MASWQRQLSSPVSNETLEEESVASSRILFADSLDNFNSHWLVNVNWNPSLAFPAALTNDYASTSRLYCGPVLHHRAHFHEAFGIQSALPQQSPTFDLEIITTR